MAIDGTPVQTAEDANSASSSLTIDGGDGWSTPASGNLLILAVAIREDGSDDPDITLSGSSGWTLLESYLGTETGQAKGALYWKESDGTETTVTITPATTPDSIAACWLEFNDTDLDISAIEQSAEDTSETANGSATTNGSGNLTNTSADSLCIAMLAVKTENRWSVTGPSVDNGYSIEADTLAEGAGSSALCAVAVKVTSSSANQECTWSTTDDGGHVWNAMVIFAGAAVVAVPGIQVFRRL